MRVPLRVTATTPHGVVLSLPWGIALDGLLASVLWHRRKWSARQAGVHLTYHHDQPPEPIELPLARCGDPATDDDWHWMATFADLHPHTYSDPDIRWRTSRTDRHRLQALTPAGGSNVVSDRSGRYQHRMIPVIAHPVTSLTWRAVGDPDAIRDLLADRRLKAIGKHTGVGEGVVTRWEVTETPDVTDWAAGHEHEPGVIGRTIPLRCLRHETHIAPSGLATIRPPYLHPYSRTHTYPPAR